MTAAHGPKAPTMKIMRVKDRTLLRRSRIRRRYSQEDLSLLCRKSQQAISHLESGRAVRLTESFALNIAKWLDVPWADLFEDDPEES